MGWFFPPLFVLTTITPFAALEPYMEAEAASLSTDIDSISWGLRLLRLPSIPSTITRGAPLLRVPTPLILIKSLSLPGSPEPWVTCTPGAVPAKACPTLVRLRFSITSESITATEPVIFLLSSVPYPVTTTSSSSFPSARTTSTWSPETATSWVRNQ